MSSTRRRRTKGEPKRGPRPLTEQELEKMAEHVVYEIGEAEIAFGKWAELGTDDDRNSTIEVALLHLRILRDFYSNNQQFQDDVIARDYIPGWEPKAHKEELDPLTKSVVAINKRLAHLSKERIIQKDPWPREAFQAAIISLRQSFINELSSERRTWFEKLPQISDKPLMSNSGSTETRYQNYIFLNEMLIHD